MFIIFCYLKKNLKINTAEKVRWWISGFHFIIFYSFLYVFNFSKIKLILPHTHTIMSCVPDIIATKKKKKSFCSAHRFWDQEFRQGIKKRSRLWAMMSGISVRKTWGLGLPQGRAGVLRRGLHSHACSWCWRSAGFPVMALNTYPWPLLVAWAPSEHGEIMEQSDFLHGSSGFQKCVSQGGYTESLWALLTGFQFCSII